MNMLGGKKKKVSILEYILNNATYVIQMTLIVSQVIIWINTPGRNHTAMAINIGFGAGFMFATYIAKGERKHIQWLAESRGELKTMQAVHEAEQRIIAEYRSGERI